MVKIKTILKGYINSGNSYKENQDKWLRKTLENIPSGLRILDAGAGELRNKKFCKHLNYVSQDFCQYEGSGNGKALQVGTWSVDKIDIIGDIVNIPEKNESFDVILCSEVFEHIPNPVEAIKEFQRLLKKDGILIITAPFCSLTHFAPYHFNTGFNSYFYTHHLNFFGFEIEEITTNGNFFEYIAQEIWRIRLVAKTYTSRVPSLIDKLTMLLTLKMLSRFSKRDTGSDELLCHGYHVVAKKL
jgi:SAM-dependent methyltransferase